jgi:hypothetical protein
MILLLRLLPLVLVSAQDLPRELVFAGGEHIGFTDNAMSDLEQGKVVGKVLPSEQQEVAVLGIARIKATFRDI